MAVNGFVTRRKMDVKLVLAALDVVGESGVWDDRRGRLVWVDNIGQRIELRAVAETIPSMDVGLAWSNSRPLSPAAAVFRAFMSVAMGGGG